MIELLKRESQKKLEECITEIEKKTSAEVILAISRKSGEYKDVYYLSGLSLSLISLFAIIFSPFQIHPAVIIPDILIFFLAGYYLAQHFPIIVSFLTTPERRTLQVRKASQNAFFEEGVSATSHRTGILFYISLFERQMEILPDVGVDGKVPRAHWNHLRHDMHELLRKKHNVDELLKLFCRCGVILEEFLPATGDNPDEIPNRPRILG